MKTQSLSSVRFRLFALFVTAAMSVVIADGQSIHPGVELYKAGKTKEAAKVLSSAVRQDEYKTNAEMWNFLGLAYNSIDEDKSAKKAFETATKLKPGNASFRVNLGYVLLVNRKINDAQSQFEKALKIDPRNVDAVYLRGISNLWEDKLDSAMADAESAIGVSPQNFQGYVLKSDVLIAMLGKKVVAGANVRDEVDFLRQAVGVLEDGSKLVSSEPDKKHLASELEGKTVFYKYFTREKADPLLPKPAPDPGVTPLKVLTKRKASYTDRARSAGVEGQIRIAVLFGANGKIEHTLLLKRLGYGLDEQALSAARNITFEPQKKDGKALSVVRIVEYGFDIY